jgi:hypothetical protein
VSVAWLLVRPFQLPWYDAIAMCLLALYPPSRLDRPVLARQVAGTLFYMPCMVIGMHTGWPGVFTQAERYALVPIIRLAALAAVVALAITGPGTPRPGHRRASPAHRWRMRSEPAGGTLAGSVGEVLAFALGDQGRAAVLVPGQGAPVLVQVG